MEYKQLIISIVISIVSALFGAVFKSLADKLMPEKDQIVKYVRSAAIFFFRYIMPVIYLIYLFLEAKFDKLFVLAITIIVSAIFINAMLDFVMRIRNSIVDLLIKTIDANNDTNLKHMSLIEASNTRILKGAELLSELTRQVTLLTEYIGENKKKDKAEDFPNGK